MRKFHTKFSKILTKFCSQLMLRYVSDPNNTINIFSLISAWPQKQWSTSNKCKLFSYSNQSKSITPSCKKHCTSKYSGCYKSDHKMSIYN